MMKQILSLFIVLVIGFIPGSLFPGEVSITKIGEWGTGIYYDVYIQGHYIYCAAGGAGLDIIDISDPSVPKKVGNHDTPGAAYALYVDGDYAYVTDWEGELGIFDVSDPGSPVLISNYNFAGGVRDVYVKGHTAYLACNDSGLHIVDVSDPANPTPIGVYDTIGEAMGVYVVGDYAYVADGYKGLQIIDVTIPSSPVSVGAYDTAGYSRRVYVKGNYSYIAGNYGGLQIIDISDPSAPVLAGSVSTSDKAKDVFINGNYAYVAIYEGGLQVIDISEPSDPVVMGSVDTPGTALGIHLSDNIAYVADYDYGLQLLDVSDPSSPGTAGSVDNTLAWSFSVYVKGNYAYLAGSDKFHVLDISDPSSPNRVGMCVYSGSGRNIHVSGNYAYIAAVQGGLQIIDVSKPTAPTHIGKHYFVGQTYDVYSRGNYAYVAGVESIGFRGKLQIFDVSNPFSPSPVGDIFTSYYITEFAVFGDYAYALLCSDQLEVIDISNPSEPKFVGNCEIPGRAIDIPVTGNYAYAAYATKGLQVIDISIPSAPTLIGSCDTPGWTRDVITVDGYAYMADSDEGLQVIDVSNPYSPSLVGSYDTQGYAEKVYVKENYVYVADAEKLIILYVDKSSTSPRIRLNRSGLYFASDGSGAATPAQSLFITNSGGGTLDWTASTNQKWLNCSPASGTNSGEISVSINATGLVKGTYQGTIIISDPNASNSPQTVEVTLMVYVAGQTSGPFGVVATPTDGAVVSGSIPITGWVLDDIGVQSVAIFREVTNDLVFIGEAAFIEGARPDVEQAYPGYPMNYQAGWGYMMLTNFLPNEGNSTFKIHAIATDLEGNQVTLGTKTITCDNANAVKPFGTVDTPLQGGTASGNNYINWGWALAPQPNTIPTDGSTITVWVDGVSLGKPVYNQFRGDIAALFPGYNNSGGAGGYFYLDTTQYENGVHNISWSVTDDAGNTDGIGSRYFSIRNSSQSAERTAQSAPDISKIPVDHTQPLRVKKGFNPDVEPQIFYPDKTGQITIEIKELERVEIWLFEGAGGLAPLSNAPLSNGNKFTNSHWTGFQVIGNQLRSLPIGSFLDTERGVFYWHPGAGFVGKYRFVFITGDQYENKTKKMVGITIDPRFPGFDERE
jgi:hypothetical protein